MIHIQIANTLSEDGVGDIRWVLLDPSEAPDPAPVAVQPNAANAGVATPHESTPSPHTGREADWTYQVLRVLVLAAALAGALWLASSTLERRGPGVKVPMAAASARP